MSPDHTHSIPDREPGHPARGSESTALVRHGVVRGHVVLTVGVLRSRLSEPWTLGSLADEVHLSRSQLVCAFDATVGMSPMVYLRKMRVEQMARLLAGNDLSVAEVARSVGWADANYASRYFHAPTVCHRLSSAASR